MDIVPYLSAVILVATIATILLAILSYAAFKLRDKRKPKVSASSSAGRVAGIARWREFVRAYREAREAWVSKRRRRVEFPAGTWLMRKRFGVRCAPGAG